MKPPGYVKTVILFLLLALPSAAGEISFVHIGLDEGLSQNTVLSIEQDASGNMWFATFDGLNRYDGYDFTVFRHDESDSTSIANDIVRTVETDGQGRLWIGTYTGLSMYDAGKGCFLNYSFTSGGLPAEIRNIVSLENGLLLLNTSAGLQFFDTSTGNFMNIRDIPDMDDDFVTSMTGNGMNAWVGTKNGRLFFVDGKTSDISEIRLQPILGKRIQAILHDPDGLLWIGTEGQGLFRINPADGACRRYCTASEDLSSDYVRSLCRDSENRLWIGTFSSLNVLDEKTDRITVYDSNPAREGSLSHSSVRSIFKDRQGGMWIGTYYGGLNYYHPLLRRFSTLKNIPYANSLNDDRVSCISKDSDGHLWIGTNSGGVNRYDPATGKFSFYTAETGLKANDIKAIYIDSDHVYVGMHHGGMDIIDRRSGTIRNFDIADNNVYAIVPYSDNSLILGSVNGSLWHFDKNGLTASAMLDTVSGNPADTGKLITVFIDSENRIWTGTETGVKTYSGEGHYLSRIALLPPNDGLDRTFVNCIFEASDGKFWLGTRNGLYCFDESDGSLAHYTVKDGLPSNVVYGILEDAVGRLWLSSGHRISRFDIKERTFRNYPISDGLQGGQFSLYSYCRTADGTMYFGGTEGITVFSPESLPDNHFIPAVSIAELHVANSLVRPGDGSGILSKDIGKTDEIRLHESNSSFALTFTVHDYISWKQNSFAYRLEGYDDEWKYVKSPERTVSYAHLPPGRYVFSVTAANKDGVWNEKPATLAIVIRPFWYNTWWSRVLIAAVLMGAVCLAAKYLWERKKMLMQLEYEKVDKERLREVNEMKLKFFINISHELRTPLTMIAAPLQELVATVKDKWILKRLKYMGKSTSKLLYLVNQLMDYRRAELGVFRLKVRQADMEPLLQQIFGYYVYTAASEKIDYRIESSLNGTPVYFDAKYVEMILNNLLSNAFKYTPSGHSITLSAGMDGNMLLLSVSDTGKGIAPEKLHRIFDRFYQVDQEHIGSGIGLSLVKSLTEMHHGRVGVESTPGEGSTFSIWLPADRSAYAENEISSENDDNAYSSNPTEMYVLAAKDESEDESTSGNETDRVDNDDASGNADSGNGGKASVMIVEDNRDILEYLSDGLSADFDIMTAGNGEEAIEKMKEKMPDLILSDVMMPVMDGIRLCRTVKQNLETSHITVIMLSAKSDLKWQLEGLNVGADDYIPKPFSLAAVEAKIRNILRTRMNAIRHYSDSVHVEPEKMALNKLDEEFLKKAVVEVEKHLNDTEFSADMFADGMNMSRSNLHIKMKALTGSSSMDFIRKIRMSKACEFLKDGRYSIADISAMVGYSSPAYFTTAFKKHVGCLPSEYKG